MHVTLIAAMTRDRTIGAEGEMPWHLPGDLAHFQRETMGHALVVGRKTFEAMGALAGRTVIVLTRRSDYRPESAFVAHDLDEALALARRESREETVFVGGGAEVFEAALPRAERMVLTRIHADIAGDTRFPEVDPDDWRLVSSERHPAAGRDPYAYTIEIWERVSRP